MSYNCSAEKRGRQNLQFLHNTLMRFVLCEFFPIEVREELLTLGISIPLKAMDEPGFENELEEVMRFLIVKQGFNVTDLYTGSLVLVGNISGLAKKISR